MRSCRIKRFSLSSSGFSFEAAACAIATADACACESAGALEGAVAGAPGCAVVADGVTEV